MTSLRQKSQSWAGKIIAVLILLPPRIAPGLSFLAGQVHDGTGWFLLLAGRKLTAWLQPVRWSVRLGPLLTAEAVLLAWFFLHGRTWLLESSGLFASHLQILDKTPLPGYLSAYEWSCLPAALLMALAALLVFLRRPVAFYVARVAAWLFTAYACGFMFFASRVPSAIFDANDKSFAKDWRNELWINGFLIWLVLMVLALLVLFGLYLRSARTYYFRRPCPAILASDRVVRDLKTHGGEPVYRTSMYWSLFFHIFFVFILPLLVMRSCRMEKPYGVPLGSGVQQIGDPIVRMVRIKRPPKKQVTKYVLNMNSPISFYRPQIDDSPVLDQVNEATEEIYQATGVETAGGSALGGKLGKGGGRRGGWPNGMENSKIRFIRLEYGGGDWDQDMGVGADYNFLIQFNKLTNFQIADQTEHIAIPQLRRFPKDRAPPFVFLTGSGDIGVSTAEVKVLRRYCLEEGGMIFADNGGGTFDTSVRNLMRRCFPELTWIDIANDDIIFTQPYPFPTGAPPLWHHSGNRAMGLKYNGRWIVFYHQGDVNDAWKTGHSGASQFVTLQSYKLGVNVVNYAFNQYMGIHFKE